MKGHYFLKTVLPALYPDNHELDYNRLSLIHSGSEVPEYYNKLPEMDESQRNIIKKELQEYCCIDSLALVKIYEKLKQAITE